MTTQYPKHYFITIDPSSMLCVHQKSAIAFLLRRTPEARNNLNVVALHTQTRHGICQHLIVFPIPLRQQNHFTNAKPPPNKSGASRQKLSARPKHLIHGTNASEWNCLLNTIPPLIAYPHIHKHKHGLCATNEYWPWQQSNAPIPCHSAFIHHVCFCLQLSFDALFSRHALTPPEQKSQFAKHITPPKAYTSLPAKARYKVACSQHSSRNFVETIDTKSNYRTNKRNCISCFGVQLANERLQNRETIPSLWHINKQNAVGYTTTLNIASDIRAQNNTT